MILGDDAMRVLAWALVQRKPITKELLMRTWDVSRATAYRWLPRLEQHREMVDLYVSRANEQASRARRGQAPQREALRQ